ncbi:MAG: ABC-F family ATP-binding cassette domain-containing protein, partial [Flavobacteriaceae bacterium]|nr:ABC-F family ATP-binding cassette domain-containing protein [Flavobacteriaceae bacterium]
CFLTTKNQFLKAIRQYEQALKNPEDTDAYQKAFEQMERLNAWDYDVFYKQLLFQLKLQDLDEQIKNLSGGQKKRLALALALLNKPDLLILDEPTNHLDLETIEWMEDYFKKQQFTLLMVTHDRYFLDRVCNEIFHLDDFKIYIYRGNYSYFLEQKALKQQITEVTQQKSIQLYKKELDWMRRQPKARTTKSKSRIDDFKTIKEQALQRRKEHRVELEIDMHRLGTKVIELHQLHKSFDDLKIIDNLSYKFLKGERLGIIGKNGTGKTTFLKLLAKQLSPDSGKIVYGETLKIGYYTQDGLQVDNDKKVIDVIKAHGEYIPLAKGKILSASQLLERFLFDAQKQYDYVEKLSGGEKKRLYLCTVLIKNPNFLILDEPTNDLDIETLAVLEQFLNDFPGNVVIVSHDRYFMDKIVDHLFVFEGHGNILDFPGNYSDYRSYQESKPTEDGGKSEATEKYQESDRIKKIERKIKKLEQAIESAEESIKKLQDQFLQSDLSPEDIAEISTKIDAEQKQKNDLEYQWNELVDQI